MCHHQSVWSQCCGWGQGVGPLQRAGPETGMGRTRAGVGGVRVGGQIFGQCQVGLLTCQSFIQEPWCIHNVPTTHDFHISMTISPNTHTYAKMAATLTQASHMPHTYKPSPRCCSKCAVRISEMDQPIRRCAAHPTDLSSHPHRMEGENQFSHCHLCPVACVHPRAVTHKRNKMWQNIYQHA